MTDVDGNGADGGTYFPCGESGHYVYCDWESSYCLLVRTSQSRSYSCDLPDGGFAPTCAGYPPASVQYACGCYTGPNGEVTITICQ